MRPFQQVLLHRRLWPVWQILLLHKGRSVSGPPLRRWVCLLLGNFSMRLPAQCKLQWATTTTWVIPLNSVVNIFINKSTINYVPFVLTEPTKSTHPNCPRSNGFYAFPAATSCQSFYHCLEGQAYEKTCPEGVIFDPSKGSCIHPDMSKRPECAAKEVLHFTCPNSLNRFAKLRFGDHDRHSHPDDCRKFLICLKSGKPRVGGCPKGRVFNGETGFCDKPEAVKGWWVQFHFLVNLISIHNNFVVLFRFVVLRQI